MLLWVLNRKGWKQTQHTVVHTPENVDKLVLDGRACARHKLYYMVLLRLAQCLHQSPVIPSDRSQYYYRLLLTGAQVDPNLQPEQYKALCSKKGSVLPLPRPEPIDLPVAEPVPPAMDDEDLVIGGGPRAPTEEKTKDEGHRGTIASCGSRPRGRPRASANASGRRWRIWLQWWPRRRMPWCASRRAAYLVGSAGLGWPRCPIPGVCGTACHTTKGASVASCKRRGDIEPWALLLAWRHTPIVDVARTHANRNPANDKVDATVAA